MPDKKPIGMYGETPSVKVGNFTISRMDPEGDDTTIWIDDAAGDAGEFLETAFEKAIREFFNKSI